METKQILLSDLLPVEFPVLLAPMYKLSSIEMTVAAINAGIAACIPAANWKTSAEMTAGIQSIRKQTSKAALGINIWTHKYNNFLAEQIAVCQAEQVDFVYTSLGKPEIILNAFKNTNTKVFCAVATEKQALEAQQQSADALIISRKIVFKAKEKITIPIIVSGEISNGKAIYDSIYTQKAAGCAIASLFIVAEESAAATKYKKACISFSAKDIVVTAKEMPFPVSVINTTYIRRQGRSKPFIIKLFSKISSVKNFLEQKQFEKTLQLIEKASKNETHKKLWLASKSIKATKTIEPTTKIIARLKLGYEQIEKQKIQMSRSVSRTK